MRLCVLFAAVASLATSLVGTPEEQLLLYNHTFQGHEGNEAKRRSDSDDANRSQALRLDAAYGDTLGRKSSQQPTHEASHSRMRFRRQPGPYPGFGPGGPFPRRQGGSPYGGPYPGGLGGPFPGGGFYGPGGRFPNGRGGYPYGGPGGPFWNGYGGPPYGGPTGSIGYPYGGPGGPYAGGAGMGPYGTGVGGGSGAQIIPANGPGPWY